MVSEFEHLATRTDGQPGRIALIAMDGEHAWEYFPFNGYYFLTALYAALADHPRLELTTLGEFTRAARQDPIWPGNTHSKPTVTVR